MLFWGQDTRGSGLKFAGRRRLYRLTSTRYVLSKQIKARERNGSVTFFQIDEKNPDLYRRLR
jgi:hypothetical protein